jgi:DNA-binding response OmpR family regulator
VPEPSKILLVEDDPHLAKGLQFNLNKEGYAVFLVDNGVSALGQLRGNDFDLIILDLMLPRMGGLEVARKIRETNRRFPILMLTAKSSKKDKEVGLEAGADDYLTKPFHLPELLLRVKGILALYTMLTYAGCLLHVREAREGETV